MEDVGGIILILVLLIIGFVLGAFVGGAISDVTAYQAICEHSGYDGHEEVNGIHYCYTQNSDGAVFVEVLVCDN